MLSKQRLFLSASILLLSACGGSDFDDLNVWMAEIKAKPKGVIEEIPSFIPYKNYNYAATALRAPFDRPVQIQEVAREVRAVTTVEPDDNRVKEYLEQFNFESLEMVGTLKQDGQLWILIDDGDGGVHRVKEGNYLGRNHGQIITATESYVSVIEIVSTGNDSWVERPRTLKLDEN